LAVEVHHLESATEAVVLERGVVIHGSLSWAVAYFPGPLDNVASPSDPESIRVIGRGEIVRYHKLTDCDPNWVTRTWCHIAHARGGFQAPEMTRVWELSAAIARHSMDHDRAVLR
jgi:hypothetical protein